MFFSYYNYYTSAALFYKIAFIEFIFTINQSAYFETPKKLWNLLL